MTRSNAQTGVSNDAETAPADCGGRHLWRSALLLALPGWLGLLVLSLPLPGGWIWIPIAALGTLAGIAGLMRDHFQDLGALRAYLARLGSPDATGGGALPDPPVTAAPGLDRDLPRLIDAAIRTRDRRQRELHATLASSEAVLAGLPDPLLLLDREGRVLRANRAARRLFGGCTRGRPLATVLRHPELLRAADQVLAGGGETEVEFALPGELERHFSARLASLADPAADAAAVISLHDVTGMKRAEQMRADFVANASHELRTPLSSLLGFIETLQGPAQADADARERFLPIMLEQARRMSNLVEDLLSLSRIELDEHAPPRGTADIATIAERVAGSLELRARKRDMAIRLELPETDLRAVGDGDQVTQVIQNLVDNAIKYGRPGTEIRVAAWATTARCGPGGHTGTPAVAVAVSDRGEGIARAHIPRLTERFYRVDTARSREMGGTGLGLAIVKHIVNRHRGILDVDSEVGHGSTFTVYLPAAESARYTQAPPARAANA